MKIVSLLKFFRQKQAEALAEGINWRSFFDSLRPMTSAIWTQLPLNEKQRFLRHLFSLWNRHRHRMPPHCFEVIKEAEKRGQLKLIQGRFLRFEQEKESKIVVHYSVNNLQKTLKTDHLINCSGPDYDASHHSPLLISAENKGLLAMDELKRGWRLTLEESPPLYLIGSPLFGSLFETTAVPELRLQAQEVAQKIIKQLSTLQSQSNSSNGIR